MKQQLHVIQVANVKDILMEGLAKKIGELGELRIPFDLSTDYPSRETFNNNSEGNPVQVRRIVVKRVNETVSHYAIGHTVAGETNLDTMEESSTMGWLDNTVVEVSVWSSDSRDRDNMMQLVKLWMLELEQDIQQGNLHLQTPFFFDRELYQVRYLRGYDDSNHDWKTPTGIMYIGSLIFEVKSPFFHPTAKEYLEKYKAFLVSQVVDCI